MGAAQVWVGEWLVAVRPGQFPRVCWVWECRVLALVRVRVVPALGKQSCLLYRPPSGGRGVVLAPWWGALCWLNKCLMAALTRGAMVDRVSCVVWRTWRRRVPLMWWRVVSGLVVSCLVPRPPLSW